MYTWWRNTSLHMPVGPYQVCTYNSACRQRGVSSAERLHQSSFGGESETDANMHPEPQGTCRVVVTVVISGAGEGRHRSTEVEVKARHSQDGDAELGRLGDHWRRWPRVESREWQLRCRQDHHQRLRHVELQT